jgi:hypothetical protein
MHRFCAPSLGAILLVATTSFMASVSAEPSKNEASVLVKAMCSLGSTQYQQYQKYSGIQSGVLMLSYKNVKGTELPWHSQSVINTACVIFGHITAPRKNDVKDIMIDPDDVLVEMVSALHHGHTSDEAVELIVFYAGTPPLPWVIRKGA